VQSLSDGVEFALMWWRKDLKHGQMWSTKQWLAMQAANARRSRTVVYPAIFIAPN